MINNLKTLLRQIIPQKKSMPRKLMVEPTNYCNLNCPFCIVGSSKEYVSEFGDASHHNLKRPRGYLSSDTFENIVKHVKSSGINRIGFLFQGEPLLHKEFTAMLTRLRKENIWIEFFTNGMLLNEDLARKIADSGVNFVRFSIDGATSETYAKNRVGGDFDKVIHNLKILAKLTKEKDTKVIWQFIVLSNNEHEIELAGKLAREIGVEIYFKDFAETIEELAPKNVEYRRKKLKKPCKTIYDQMCIYWNGDIVPCCYDIDGRNIFGNINKNSFKEIWNSESYKKFRKLVDHVSPDNQENQPGMCKTCLRWEN